MTNCASRHGRWALVVTLTVTVGFTGYLQVETAYDQGEAVQTARELAAPVDDLCRSDVEAARRLGREVCDHAARVVARQPADSVSTLLGPIGHAVDAVLGG